MKICAVIVAGGGSSRMGREKAFELIRGQSIIDRIVACLGAQMTDVMINANGDVQRFGHIGIPVIGDLRKDIHSPVAGLHAALAHGRDGGYGAVLTVPSDAPFLPSNLVERLLVAARPAAIAASAGQRHFLTGLWSTSLLDELERAMDSQLAPRLQDWVSICKAAEVEWAAEPYDPFLNVNTPQELAEAQRLAAEFDL